MKGETYFCCGNFVSSKKQINKKQTAMKKPRDTFFSGPVWLSA